MKSLYYLFQTWPFYPLKILMMMFYLYVVIPFLLLLYKMSASDVVSVQARHSVKNKSTFIPFWSDLDYSIIVKDSITSKQIEDIVCLSEKLKKKLIFLDQPEIYSESEMRILSILKSDERFMKIWNFVYCVRKISWEMEKKIKNETVYHEIKRKGCLYRLLQKIEQQERVRDMDCIDIDFENTSLDAMMSSLKFHDCLPDGRFPTYSNFLGCAINSNGKKLNLIIGPNNLCRLFACIPEGINLYYDFYRKLRVENKEISLLYLKSCLFELAACNSVKRIIAYSRFSTINFNNHRKHIAYLKMEVAYTLSRVTIKDQEKDIIKTYLKY